MRQREHEWKVPEAPEPVRSGAPEKESTNCRQVAIIGGGIAGLSTAWYLQQFGIDYVLLESSDRWGGKILTETVEVPGSGRFVVEAGPDSFIAQKPWAAELAAELGLEERLLGTNDHMRKVHVLNKGRPTPLPDGVLLIVPTKFLPFALSPLISPWGKLRMGMDLFIPAKRDNEDETLADFIRRRLGSEALDKIAEPLMSGIYNADAEQQSLLATFPRFRALEQRHGSLTRGMLASRKARGSARSQNGTGAQSNGRPTSMFISLTGGTGELVDGLVQLLTGDLRLNSPVVSLELLEHGESNGYTEGLGPYQLALANGEMVRASAVVLATPAFAAARLLDAPSLAAGEAVELLASIRYVSTGTISLAFREADLGHEGPGEDGQSATATADGCLDGRWASDGRRPDGFGLVIPRSERRPFNALTWSSVKFDHRAPAGHVLLRMFFGGSRSPQSMGLDDHALLEAARRELRELLHIEAEPLFHRIYRWYDSNPQYDVGHLERVAAIEAALPTGVYVTGSPYRGVGIPDCVRQARDTAQRVADSLIAAVPGIV